jgi:hypothetical protein
VNMYDPAFFAMRRAMRHRRHRSSARASTESRGADGGQYLDVNGTVDRRRVLCLKTLK